MPLCNRAIDGLMFFNVFIKTATHGNNGNKDSALKRVHVERIIGCAKTFKMLRH